MSQNVQRVLIRLQDTVLKTDKCSVSTYTLVFIKSIAHELRNSPENKQSMQTDMPSIYISKKYDKINHKTMLINFSLYV